MSETVVLVESCYSSSSLETRSGSASSSAVVAAQRFSSIYALCSHSKTEAGAPD